MPDTRQPSRYFSAGVRDMIVASVLFSIMGIIVKMLGERIPSTEMVFARSAVTLVLSFWMLRRAGLSWKGERRGLLFLRGALGFGALMCFFYGITHLPLGDVMVLQFSNPIIATFLAAAFLGERIGPREAVSGLIALAGVILVARPEFLFGAGAGSPDPAAILIALAGAVMTAVVYVTIRNLRTTEDPLVIVAWFPIVATPLAIPVMAADAVVPDLRELGLLLLMGVIVQVAQVFMTHGLHRETTARATTVSYLQVALGFVWGLLLFDEVPALTSIAGAVLIVVGVAVTAAKKQPAAAPVS